MTKQHEIVFETGLLDQFPDFQHCVKASVYGCGRALKAVAADLDMTSSELSRKLATNVGDTVHFPLDRLPELITATGDRRPVYWLIERFLESPEQRRKQAIDHLADLLPTIAALCKEAKAAEVTPLKAA